jgi:hypothetical protein
MPNKPYISKTSVSNHHKNESTRRITNHLTKQEYCSCKALKGRKVYLTKYTEATIRQKDVTRRLRSFFVAIDIIKHSHEKIQRTHKGLVEYDIIGHTQTNEVIHAHIREEKDGHHNKKLFLISSFEAKS